MLLNKGKKSWIHPLTRINAIMLRLIVSKNFLNSYNSFVSHHILLI